MRKDFVIDLSPYGDYHIRPTIWEHFKSLSDLEAGIDRMEPYFDEDYFIDGPHNPNFNGFSSPEELRGLLKGGVRDTSSIRKVCKLKAASNKSAYVKRQHLDVMGEEVDVPTYLTGVPECMIDTVKRPVPKKSLRLVIDGSILGELGVEELIEASLVISKVVLSLEKQGRPVILSNFHAAVANRNLLVTSIDIRRPGSQLDPRKLLFCTHPSLHRGAIFTWRRRITQNWNVGRSLYVDVDEHSDFVQMLKDHFFREKELYLIRISDVVEILEHIERTPGWEDVAATKVFEEFIR